MNVKRITNELSVERIVRLLDLRKESYVGRNSILLQEKYGLENLLPYYVQAFYLINNWPGRMYISFWLARYARKYPMVVQMAVHGLRDRSYIVRHHCCGTLAFALDIDTIEHLQALKDHKDKKTHEDAEAAIDAIKNMNHHYFVDRSHTGKVHWAPGKID